MAEPVRRRVQPGDSGQSTDEVRGNYADFAKQLLSRRDEIIGRREVARHNLDEQVMSSPGDAADESVIDTSADYFLRLANTAQDELVAIRDALDRMHRGVYGVCENCENPIATERLKRLPYARYCIDCQSAEERKNPLRSVPRNL